jgi:hypothetical protein
VIGGVNQEPRWYNGCAYVDPDSKWENDASAACSARCQNISEPGFVCDGANWSVVEPVVGPQTCPEEDTLDTATIEAALGALAAADAAQLPCELWDSCFDFFGPAVQEALSTPPSASVRYTADTLLETVPLASSLMVTGNAQATPTVQTLAGEAAYTTSACPPSEPACPIYMPDLDLVATSPFSVTIGGLTGVVTKTFSDVELHLKQPAMGIWLPNFDYVIFPPDSLVFTVEGVVSGTEIAGENGYHNVDHIVRGYVFGTLDGGLTISAEGVHPLADFSVYGEFIPE